MTASTNSGRQKHSTRQLSRKLSLDKTAGFVHVFLKTGNAPRQNTSKKSASFH